MPIEVVCTGCSARYQVPETNAGHKGPCRQCGATIVVPSSQPQASSLDALLDSESQISGQYDLAAAPTAPPPLPSQATHPLWSREPSASQTSSDESSAHQFSLGKLMLYACVVTAVIFGAGLLLPQAFLAVVFLIAALIIIVCGLWTLALVASDGILPLLLYLFVPFYPLYWTATRWNLCRTPTLISIAALIPVFGTIVSMLVRGE